MTSECQCCGGSHGGNFSSVIWPTCLSKWATWKGWNNSQEQTFAKWSQMLPNSWEKWHEPIFGKVRAVVRYERLEYHLHGHVPHKSVSLTCQLFGGDPWYPHIMSSNCIMKYFDLRGQIDVFLSFSLERQKRWLSAASASAFHSSWWKATLLCW